MHVTCVGLGRLCSNFANFAFPQFSTYVFLFYLFNPFFLNIVDIANNLNNQYTVTKTTKRFLINAH